MSVLLLARREFQRNWLRFILAGSTIASGVAILIASDLLSRATTAEIARIEQVKAVTSFMTEQMNVGLTVIGVIISAAAGLLVFNVYLMAVHERAHEISRLRAVGMQRGQLLRLLALETMGTGVVGVLAGIPGGIALNAFLIRLVVQTSPMFNRFAQPSLSFARVVLAAGLGLAAAALASWLPIRRALARPPLASSYSIEAVPTRREDLRRLLRSALIMAVIGAFTVLGKPSRWLFPPSSDRINVAAIGLWVLALFLAAPALAGFASRVLRPTLNRVLGICGRLAAENLGRARGRVSRTMVTLAVGTAMIVAVNGFLFYWFEELFFRDSVQSLLDRPALGVFPLDIEAGLAGYEGLTSFAVLDTQHSIIERAAGEGATVVEMYFTIIPELSFLGQQYFSFILDPEDVKNSGDLYFSFNEGDWEHALPLMQEGCGLLLTVSVAGKNNVELYDPLTISTPRGPLECRVAGIGPTYVGASIVSTAAVNSLRLGAPVSIVVFPEHPDQLQALRSSLEAALSSDGDLHIIDLSIMVEMQREGMKSAQVLMNSMLLLAILLASLSVLNMMLISLRERSREFSLLRAIGATRRQIGLIVTVEGGLYGLLGGALGLFTGAGILWIYIYIAGGNMFGFPDFPVAEAAWNTLEATIPSAILTLLAAPLLTSLSCLPAVRAILNQDNLEELRGIET